MSIPTPVTPSFTPVFETASQAIATAYPTGFSAEIAALMGQACQLTYLQYQQTKGAPVELSQLALVTGVSSYGQLGNALTWTEAIGIGAVQPGSPGLATVPFGFAFTAQDSNSKPVFNVIAFRGTRSYSEWVADAEATPAEFNLAKGDHLLPALVHGGFYGLYNAGGATPPASGTLADQVRTILKLVQQQESNVPLYITGHSLGGALAELCAADVGANFGRGYFSALYEYSLASPQVAAGITTTLKLFNSPIEIPTTYFTGVLTSSVLSGGAYRIVNSADLIPLLPFTVGSPSGWGVEFAPSIPASATVNWLVQTGDIGGNHAVDLYADFLDQLPATWPAQ